MPSHKLTLSVRPDVVEAAKQYAAANGTSVSQLVEDFLAAVTSDSPVDARAPILARLRGALRDGSVDDHRDHLAEKYR